jgi:hypothetical protein
MESFDDEQLENVAHNLKQIRLRMEAAAQRAGRRADSVQLVAVSKNQPASMIRQAYEAGQRVFGENYAQELRDKANQLADLKDIQFHFIGSLQKNKAKYVASVASMFQSLDDLDLARELDKRTAAARRMLPVLVEINFGEEQKGGVAAQQLPLFIDSLRVYRSLCVKGLMCIPPQTTNQDETRLLFRQLASLGQQHNLSVISMGMSSDFEIAIAEGATHVRVGTAIFGERRKRE